MRDLLEAEVLHLCQQASRSVFVRASGDGRDVGYGGGGVAALGSDRGGPGGRGPERGGNRDTRGSPVGRGSLGAAVLVGHEDGGRWWKSDEDGSRTERGLNTAGLRF